MEIYIPEIDMKKKTDVQNLDLFDLIERPNSTPGSMNFSSELRHLISAELKRTSLSRYEVAARMSEFSGAEISKNQLDSWAAESREGWRFPLEYVPAFEAACETYALTRWLAAKRGCKVLIGEEALFAELAKIERDEGTLKKRKKEIQSFLDAR